MKDSTGHTTIGADEYEHRSFFNNLTMNEKPKINALVLIANGEINSIDMHEGDVQTEKRKIESEVEKLIYLRNIVEAEIQNFEKKQQAKFLNRVEDEK